MTPPVEPAPPGPAAGHTEDPTSADHAGPPPSDPRVGESDAGPTAASSRDGASMEPWLREIVRCPRCKGELADTAERDALTCGVCDLAYPVENGVPVLLVELAHPIRV